MKYVIRTSVFFLVILASPLNAQFVEDALRLAAPPTLISARSAGMGNAFVGLANDASALYWNPAGLGQMRTSEFTFGLSNSGVSNQATLLGNTNTGSNRATSINNVQLALPFPVARGSFVLAAGYSRLVDYTSAMSVDAYNPWSSIQPSLYRDEEFLDMDFAWNLGLQDTLGQAHILNDVHQTIDVLESGNLNLWSFGGSIEVAPNAMVGLALNLVSGSYRYDRVFIERDVRNAHQGTIFGIDQFGRTDFQFLELEELIDQNLSGFNLRVGFLYNYRDRARVGASIQTASVIRVNEDFYKTGRSGFANDNMGYELSVYDINYTVTTPAVYTFGASYNPIDWATIAGDVELVDYSDLEFSDATFSTSALNRDIRRFFRATNNFRIGAEARIPSTELALRAGFGYRFSPFSEDEGKTEFDVTTFTAGASYSFEGAITLFATYMHSTFNTFVRNYDDIFAPVDAVTTDQEITASRLLFGISYRF